MARTGLERQESSLNGFDRVLRNTRHNDEPTFWEREMARSAKMKTVVKPSVQISFYNPNNPLNGIMSKSKAEQKEIARKIKQEAKRK